MDTYFGDLNVGTHVIADDVKIHGENEVTHDQNLIQVLNQCRKVGLKLNAEECVFKAKSIPFFGHVISDQGVKPDPAKMDMIKNMPTPTSKHELLSFLGLCNYLSTYVPDLSSILQPLHQLTKMNATLTGTISMTLCINEPRTIFYRMLTHCVLMIQTSLFY